MSLLDEEREVGAAPPPAGRAYASTPGDDFHYPQLIRGDEARPLRRAARHLRRDRRAGRGRPRGARRRRPRPLRRPAGADRPAGPAHLRRADRRLQDGHRLPGLARRPPGPLHDGRRPAVAPLGRAIWPPLLVLADAAGVLPDPELAAAPGAGVLRGRRRSERVTGRRSSSFNQATAPELADARPDRRVRRGRTSTQVGLWREQVAEYGAGAHRRRLLTRGRARREHPVPGRLLRRGPTGRTPTAGPSTRPPSSARPVLVLVSGGLPAGSRDLAGARAHVADAIATLVPYAAAAGVRLAIEPLHPMFAADRCVINTLRPGAGRRRAAPGRDGRRRRRHVPRLVGRPGVRRDRPGRRPDRELPAGRLDHAAAGRCADRAGAARRGLHRALAGCGAPSQAAGYTGPVEIEIFNTDLWALPGSEVLRRSLDAATACR